MPTFKNTSQLIKHIEKTLAPDILMHEVADTVSEAIKNQYEEDVYSYVGTGLYERSGALTNDENIKRTMVDANTVAIENVASPSESLIKDKDGKPKYSVIPGTLPLMIENGYIGNPWNDSHYPWMDERPVIQTTREKLDNSKAHIQAFRQGLRKRGIDAT
jgi:hypothetical protein